MGTTLARCAGCVCDPDLCATDNTGEHCTDRSCGACQHGCPDPDPLGCPFCRAEHATDQELTAAMRDVVTALDHELTAWGVSDVDRCPVLACRRPLHPGIDHWCPPPAAIPATRGPRLAHTCGPDGISVDYCPACGVDDDAHHVRLEDR